MVFWRIQTDGFQYIKKKVAVEKLIPTPEEVGKEGQL
jgi:hypothetical protein